MKCENTAGKYPENIQKISRKYPENIQKIPRERVEVLTRFLTHDTREIDKRDKKKTHMLEWRTY